MKEATGFKKLKILQIKYKYSIKINFNGYLPEFYFYCFKIKYMRYK